MATKGKPESEKEVKKERKASMANTAEKSLTRVPTLEQQTVNDVLRFVLMTEKAVQLIEAQNKLVFIVNRRATKPQIMKAAEQSFGSKISKVTTAVDKHGRKKAFIKFAKEGEAGEIAIRLGII